MSSFEGELTDEEVGGEVSGGVEGRDNGEVKGEDLSGGGGERSLSDRVGIETGSDESCVTGALAGRVEVFDNFDQGMFRSLTV